MITKEMTTSNARRTCQVTGCEERRSGISRYCLNHKNRLNRYGHTAGRVLKLKEYPETVELVERFITVNSHSDAIQRTSDLLEDWMRTGAEGFNVAGTTHTVNLYHNRVKPTDIIKVAGVVYILKMSGRFPFLETPRGFHTALGHTTLLLAPSRKVSVGHVTKRVRPDSKSKREIGEYLFNQLGTLLVSMDLTIEKHKDAIEKQEKAVRAAEFTMGTTAPNKAEVSQ